jgi:hypothetical protein
VKTIQAHDLLMVINTRDDLGAPIDVDIAPTGAPAAIATKAQVFTRIVQLLEDARTHLQSAGSAFSFSLGPGFVGFDSVATFTRVNRALKARVDVYMGNYGTALTTLTSTFIDPAASLDLGAYHVFSSQSGDAENTLFDPAGRAILAHPSIRADAQLKADGTPDARVERKVATLTPAKTVQGVTTDVLFTIYTSSSASIPIIRNEELILLRAEANIGLGTPAGRAAAEIDINTIRTRSGGLAPTTLTAANALDELLYNKRYSLLFEGGIGGSTSGAMVGSTHCRWR